MTSTEQHFARLNAAHFGGLLPRPSLRPWLTVAYRPALETHVDGHPIRLPAVIFLPDDASDDDLLWGMVEHYRATRKMGVS